MSSTAPHLSPADEEAEIERLRREIDVLETRKREASARERKSSVVASRKRAASSSSSTSSSSRLRGEEDEEEKKKNEQPDFDRLVNHLLRNNNGTHRRLFEEGDVAQWQIPLPVPEELENVERLEKLLEASSAWYGGVKIDSLVKGDGEWHLAGVGEVAPPSSRSSATLSSSAATALSIAPLRFECKFHVVRRSFLRGKTTRDVVTGLRVDVHVKPGSVLSDELAPLVALATRLSCLRTFLVGFGEFVAFHRTRLGAATRLSLAREFTTDAGLEVIPEREGSVIRVASKTNRARRMSISWIPRFISGPTPNGSTLLTKRGEFFEDVVTLRELQLGAVNENRQLESALVHESQQSLKALLRAVDGDVEKAVAVLIRNFAA